MSTMRVKQAVEREFEGQHSFVWPLLHVRFGDLVLRWYDFNRSSLQLRQADTIYRTFGWDR